MRVLVVEPSGRGGHAVYSRNLCNALAAYGIDVSLLTSRPYAYGTGARFPFSDHLVPMTTTRLNRSRLTWLMDRMARTLANAYLSYRFIKKVRPDVVHYQLPIPQVDWMWIPKLSQEIRGVITVHNVRSHRPRYGELTGMKTICRSMSKIIVHSEGLKYELLRTLAIAEHKVVVIPHAVEVPFAICTRSQARALLGLPDSAEVVLFFGVIRPNKGLDVLLRSLALVQRRSQRRIILLIAGSCGSGQNFESYRRLARELGLTGSLRSDIRFIPDEQVPRYFIASDVVACPYTEGFAAQSGVLMQSYGYRIPVIVTDVGALGETVRLDRTGLVVPPGDAEALADGLVSLLGDENLRSVMSLEMERALPSYSWEEIARKTGEVYREVLQESNRQGGPR